MGVPAFYRWLSEKYPKCIKDVREEEPTGELVDEHGRPLVDFSGPNPNAVEFDNLYLDMNGCGARARALSLPRARSRACSAVRKRGAAAPLTPAPSPPSRSIIHPCVHPEDGPAPETLEEMFAAVTAYVDRIVAVVRPRKVLFMAIDGVAPRAKMNQQRSRRFKTAADMADRAAAEAALRARLAERGAPLPPQKAGAFDHNVITPGTVFMERLAAHLRYYVAARLHAHPAWRGLAVVLSDAATPGEGEHKIMEFIRQQRAAPGYHPRTRHALHGLDADLIMLGLATHEAHFTILREEVQPPKSAGNKCFKCGQEGHRADSCLGAARAQDVNGAPPEVVIARKPLQFLHIFV